MSSSKTPVKIRLEPELARQLHLLHSGYGETTRVVTELVTAYLMIRGRIDLTEDQAIEQTVKGRTT